MLLPSLLFRPRGPMAYTDVYIDDEIQDAHGSAMRLNRLHRILFLCNDQVFRPNDPVDIANGQREPFQLKSLTAATPVGRPTRQFLVGKSIQSNALSNSPHIDKRDSSKYYWTPSKNVASRCTRAIKSLGNCTAWPSASLVGKGFFSQLLYQLTSAMRDSSTTVQITQSVCDHLRDLITLARDLSSRPTRIAKIIPSTPA
ncbi:hypothetical protein ACA910_011396 [Epithemia clementina (nom. ined.)]